MKDLLTRLSRSRFPYEPLITVEISRERLLGNLHGAQAHIRGKKPAALVAPVLKSNAYGHGLFEVAEIIERESRASPGTIPFAAVDSYFEAVALRAHGIRMPLLIIGYSRPETIAGCGLRDTAFTITSIETLRAFARQEPPVPEAPEQKTVGRVTVRRRHQARLHLKIDTGMHRQGISPDEIETAIEIIRANPSLSLEGVCTHFADAGNADSSFTDGQIHVWNRVAHRFVEAFPHIRYAHAAATDGSLYSDEIYGNVVRLGIGLYGLSENPAAIAAFGLKPVLSMKTILTGVKHIAAGASVGYGNSFTAEKDMAIATVPVGYYEGLDRRMSSGPGGQARGWMQVGAVEDGSPGAACPIIGRVSMNISVIDVSGVPGAATGGLGAGTEATVISREAAEPNSIASMARACGDITYEMVVKIPAHLRRVVVG